MPEYGKIRSFPRRACLSVSLIFELVQVNNDIIYSMLSFSLASTAFIKGEYRCYTLGGMPAQLCCCAVTFCSMKPDWQDT